ncbi:hypothetical protein MNBD_GAMMA12-2617 [hydrothermal vent metagenome]|uniref:Uncharacterized protein n=1 Tax=hydrothermal vent metagenome TaxID=652676 RepID=A0A3B0Y9X2_9ZZZZ
MNVISLESLIDYDLKVSEEDPFELDEEVERVP